jgi:Flp pilus assembly protein TadD
MRLAQEWLGAAESVRMRRVRVFVAAAVCLLWLSGCESGNKTRAYLQASQSETAAGNAFSAPPRGPETTGSIAADAQVAAAEPLAPDDPNDDLNLGKRHYHANNFGLAERYFRRAVEKGPGDTRRDAEAWLGLAASYDRLRRFELADRAYAHAVKILGPTPEILNNQGYSYLLRGDYPHARQKLFAARDLDPGNPFIQNNLDLLAKGAR